MGRMMRLAAVLLLAVLVAACGQKDGVQQIGLRGGPAASTGQAGTGLEDQGGDDVAFDFEGAEDSDSQDVDRFDPGDGGDFGTDPGAGAEAGTDPAPGQQAAPRGGQQQQEGGQQPQQQQEEEQAPAGGDSTGISDTEIRIGVHAPLTGAAPIPQRSVNLAVRQYWDHIGEVHGRKVEVFLRDDRYNPSHATSVCNELIQRQQVFLLNGVGGADQIAACARTAAQQGVPYFSSGTVQGVLENIRTYFAFSMSYKQQAPLVVNYIKANARPANNRVAIMRDRTPSFNEGVQEVQRLLEREGFDVHLRQYQNGPSDAQWLAANQIQTAFPIMAPSAWVQIVNSPGGNIDKWVGMGPTMGLNSVASAACPNINGSAFFSPWSGLNVADRLDPEWARAGRGDDIQWAAWSGYRGIHKVFDLMGADGLTRENFVHVLENDVVSTGVGPELRHSRENHFGVNQAHLLVADCSDRQFKTPPDGLFVTP